MPTKNNVMAAAGTALPEVQVEPVIVAEPEMLSAAELQTQRKLQIESLRQQADLTVKESNLSNAKRLNDALTAGLSKVGGAIADNGIFENIGDSKDLGEAMKALQTIKNMRDDMLDRCIDDGDTGKGKRGMKISVEFGNQGVNVSMEKT